MNILIVLTSHDQMGQTGHKTGFWLEEFALPYYMFQAAGANITLASPKGGRPPMDPKSSEAMFQSETTERFFNDEALQALLDKTAVLSEVDGKQFDGVFYPGGHGPVWDLAEDKDSIKLIESMYADGKPVGAVCHGPAVLRHAKTSDGSFLVDGRKVTGFSNSEEAALGLTEVVPYSLEDTLTSNGGRYQKAEDWAAFVAADGDLITGQNPASSAGVAQALLARLAG